MLLVHAGNRVDAPARADKRFPPENVGDVRKRVGRLLAALRPQGVVSAAAAGADLIVLEEAASRGIPVNVVVPLTEREFEAASVADLGPPWAEAYHRVLDIARTGQNTLTSCGFSRNDDWYRPANQAVLDRARELVGDSGVRLVALAVRPHPSSREPSVTDDFVQRAKNMGLPVLTIDPGRVLRDLPKAFVVMPFGIKTYPSTGEKIDCDSLFDKLFVPALEHANLDWERADRSLDAGMIHVDMIDQLANADLVLADLATENANVYYELGLRHALADKVTVLVARAGTKAPFDVREIRRFHYPMAGQWISDEEAIVGWAALEPVLAQEALLAARPDSPVHTLFGLPPRPFLRRDLADEQAQRRSELRALVTTAEQQGRAEELRTALQALEELDRANPLGADERAMLLLRLGIAFRYHGSAEEAMAVLGGTELPAGHPAYPRLHRELAMALRRAGDSQQSHQRDPMPYFAQASDHLDRAFRADPRDPETLGITGGLNKQLAVLSLGRGERNQARRYLERAEAAYKAGVDADPSNFYVLLNDITTGRLLAQRLSGDIQEAERTRALVPIAEFHAQQAMRRQPDDFWAQVTLAELKLTRHLLDGAPSPDVVAAEYSRAEWLRPPVDYWSSVHNQLDTYLAAGDPPHVIDVIRGAIPPRPVSASSDS